MESICEILHQEAKQPRNPEQGGQGGQRSVPGSADSRHHCMLVPPSGWAWQGWGSRSKAQKDRYHGTVWRAAAVRTQCRGRTEARAALQGRLHFKKGSWGIARAVPRLHQTQAFTAACRE